MHTRHLIVAVTLVLGLAGCGGTPAEAPTMPDVVGLKLDAALSDIKRAGIKDKVEVLGGGVFGIVDESNWEVCEQLPEAGAAPTDAPRLSVERSCGGDEPSETSPAPESSVEPSEESPDPVADDEQAPGSEADAEEIDEADEEEEVDLSNYKPHKLPKDPDKWTDEEREWHWRAVIGFEVDYEWAFEEEFGFEPGEEVVEVATSFAEDVCAKLDDGVKMKNVIKAIASLGEDSTTQTALALAVNPGVTNLCPWHVKKLKD